jgi:hypothetical protein
MAPASLIAEASIKSHPGSTTRASRSSTPPERKIAARSSHHPTAVPEAFTDVSSHQVASVKRQPLVRSGGRSRTRAYFRSGWMCGRRPARSRWLQRRGGAGVRGRSRTPTQEKRLPGFGIDLRGSSLRRAHQGRGQTSDRRRPLYRCLSLPQRLAESHPPRSSVHPTKPAGRSQPMPRLAGTRRQRHWPRRWCRRGDRIRQAHGVSGGQWA